MTSWDLQIDGGVLSRIGSRSVDRLQQVPSLLDPGMEIGKGLFGVLKRRALDTCQAVDRNLYRLGGILDLEDQGQLVLDETSLGEGGVYIYALLLCVFLSLGEDVLEGRQTLFESGDDDVV